MRIYEFLDNSERDILESVEGLIYYDGEWMFPIYNLCDVIDRSDLVIEWGNKLVRELNYRSIDPDDWTEELFWDIVKSLY